MPRVKETRPSAAALLLCTVLALLETTGQTENVSSTCALKCEVSARKTEAKCTLPADPRKLNCSHQEYANILRDVSSLDLSGNKLTEVPTGMFRHCESLTTLSLARNNINGIGEKAFACLSNRLKVLNLSFNDLRAWEVNPVNELQGLNYIDVTGNQHWLPSKQLLQLSNLTTVKGVRLSPYCQDCSLCKMTGDFYDVNNSYPRHKGLSSPSGWWQQEKIQYGIALKFIKLGFWPTCLLSPGACLTDQYYVPRCEAETDVAIKASFALYATGSVALLVNIAVVVFIAFNKALRADLAVRLILNIASCDVLVGLIAVLHARFNSSKLENERYVFLLQGNDYDFEKKREDLANIMGPILTCAVVSHVFVSSISMLDKFLRIVFAMKPDVRLGWKTTLLYLLLSWSLSIAFAILPALEVGQMKYDWQGIVPLPSDWAQSMPGVWEPRIGYAAGSQIALVIFQLTSFLLYIPIFIVAKKSGANLGIKREAAIARKIALLVFTNLIFFTVPLLIGALQGPVRSQVSKDSRSPTFREHQWQIFARDVVLLLWLSINSVLNPFLYALRHPKIKQQLDPLLSRCGTAMGECFATLRQNLRCHSTPVGSPNNEVEMHEL